MGKILGGLLAAAALTFCVTSTAHAAEIPPTANAAEIPPTAQCQNSFKEQFGKYIDDAIKARSQKQLNQADRKFFEALEATGCVTDAKPLVKAMPVKPFTDQCVAAAKQAQTYLGTDGKRFKTLTADFGRNVGMPYARRSIKNTVKIYRLKKQGRTHQAAVLTRKNQKLKREYKAGLQKFRKRVQPMLVRKAYGSILISIELASLRCIGPKVQFTPPGDGPAAKVLQKNEDLMISSYFWMLQKELGPDFFKPVVQESSKGSGKVKAHERSATLARLPFAP